MGGGRGEELTVGVGVGVVVVVGVYDWPQEPITQ